ncbi:acyl-CoA N-acyltransferase [Rhexocercosporidium sp. MPI-PUGE-AT-0058]|nr:acyl-CoA N-acyltransferase [Rhexocercosporidium sp. MPI-PUGE-AT-0058]
MAESTSPVRRRFTIRPAKPNDAEAISSLGSRVITSSFGHSLSSADLGAYLNLAYSTLAITSDISNPNIDTIVATDSHDHVVGFSQLTRGTTEPCLAGVGKTVELQRLYVSEDCHGAGIGKKLVNRIEEMAREQGFETLWLGVWEENFKAQKVYERLGFGKIGVHDFKLGECVQTDWILSKKL